LPVLASPFQKISIFVSMFDDKYFMKQALAEAKKAQSKGEIPIGAVVVCQNQIIARSGNQTEALNDVTAHAEMLAITAAANALGGKYLTECTLYVTVEPCLMCAGALSWAQIGRIVYGASDEKRGFHTFTSNALHPKTVVESGILEDECAELMTRFFQNKRSR
jgi:tRNA(adenine34) deaminase